MLQLFLDWDGIKTTIVGWIRMAIMGLISGVYQLVATLYDLFLYMTRVKLLSGDNEALVTNIYNRVQVILAVVMVFYVTLEFIKYIVNPDTFDDKEKGGGGLLKRILIVIVLMAFTPTIFGVAYDLQSRVINSDVIPKILVKNYTSSTTKNEGGEFSANLLGMFYRPYSETVTVYQNGKAVSTTYTPTGKCGGNRTPKQVVDDNLKTLREKGKMLNPTFCIETAGDDLRIGNEVKVNPFLIEMGMGGLLPIAMGLFMCWVLINYCVEAGRVIVQFVFLQVIAPIPIISYIAPNKDGMFNKWIKQCVTTYLDLFIRLFILHLIMLISGLLINVFVSNSTELFDGFFELPPLTKTLIKMFLLIGILLFAMKAPKMVKELLPGGSNAASGDFGFKPRELPKPIARAAGAALGAGYGAVSRGIKSGVATYRRNKRIKDDIRAAGGDASRKSIRNRIKEAKNKEKAARRAFNQARKDYDKGKMGAEEFSKARSNYLAAADNKVEQKQNKMGTVAGQAIKGTASGIVTGVVAGATTTKVSELHKTISNVNKSVNEKVTTHEKWMNAGVTGTFERYKAQVLAKFPGYTESDLIKTTVEKMKQDTKTLERYSSLEKQPDAACGNVKSRIESKVAKGEVDSQLAVGTYGGIVVSEENKKTVKDVINDLTGISNEATIKYEEAVKKGVSEDELSKLRNAKDKALANLTAGKDKVLKAEVGRLLNVITSGASTANEDAVAVQNAEALLSAIQATKANADTIEKVKKHLKEKMQLSEEEADKLIKCYEENKYENWDQYDKINAALQSVAAERGRTITELNAIINRTEAGEAIKQKGIINDLANGSKK